METIIVQKINVDLGMPYRRSNQSDIFDLSQRTWIEAIELINKIEFKDEDSSICIPINWGRSAEAIKDYVYYETVFSGKAFMDSDKLEIIQKDWLFKVDNKKFNVSISFEIAASKEVAIEYVKRFLRLLYIGLNLAEPGSAHIKKPEILVENDPESKSYERSENQYIALFSEPFEFIEIPIANYGWPIIHRLPFDKAWKWLLDLDMCNTVFASTNTEVALFGLLNLCKLSALEEQYELGLIYLSHALEAIFDLPEAGITNALRERIFLVLGIPDNNLKKVRQAINTFYAKRSEFVHGDMKLVNPIISPSSYPDKVTYDLDFPLWQACWLATAILVSTFQKMIENNWKSFKFSTIFEGE